MASYNKVIMIGNLTRDPQLSYLPSQTPVVEFGLASNRRWKDQNGQQREEVCFVDVRAYGKQAETISHYFNKGKPILVEGRLQFDQWEGKDGVKRSKHRISLERFSFVGPASGPGGAPPRQAPQAAPQQQQQQPQQAAPASEEAPPPPYEEEPPTGEDIPF